jgi:ribosomal protein L29
MSKMKDIKAKNEKDLAEYVKEKREAIRKFRFSLAGSRPRNVRQIRADKKEVARALTEQTLRTKEAKANSK